MNSGVSLQRSPITVFATAVIFVSTVIFAVDLAIAEGQVNLLAKSSPGDWAEYSVTRQNETIPLLGFKDQKHWRTISAMDETSVRIDEYFMLGDQRTTGLGRPVSLDIPFEPIAGLAETAVITILSENAETVTLAGKSYACTKIERKIIQPLDEETFQPKWEGTSTIWICPDVPLGGLVKMENNYVDQLTSSAEANKVSETWVLTGFGFKDWQE